jgi:Shikimate dehydrogenase substrate binding domain
MIDGDTKLIAHIGYPTASFKARSIYDPWFARRGINAAVVPLGVRSEDFREAFPQICRFTNFHGALITMPHKAVRRSGDGKLIGDMFDGEGFVRAAAAAGRNIVGQRVLIRRRRRRGFRDRRCLRESWGKRDRAHRHGRGGRGAARRSAATELPLARLERPVGVRRRG